MFATNREASPNNAKRAIKKEKALNPVLKDADLNSIRIATMIGRKASIPNLIKAFLYNLKDSEKYFW